MCDAKCGKEAKPKFTWHGMMFCGNLCKKPWVINYKNRRDERKAASFERKLVAVPAANVSAMQPGAQYKMPFQGKSITLAFVEHWGRASKFRICGPDNSRRQAIYLPQSVIKLTGHRELAPADWFWKQEKNKHKLRLAGVLL